MQTTEIYTQFPTSHVYSWISQFSVLQYRLYVKPIFSFLSAIVEMNIPPKRSPFVHDLCLSKKRSYTKRKMSILATDLGQVPDKALPIISFYIILNCLPQLSYMQAYT